MVPFPNNRVDQNIDDTLPSSDKFDQFRLQKLVKELYRVLFKIWPFNIAGTPVSPTKPTAGQTLIYDPVSGQYIPGGAGNITGYSPTAVLIPGDDGQDGTDGMMGLTGMTGPTGPTGATGLQGFTGMRGIDGEDGNDGNDGFVGPMGLQGPQGSTGSTGPQGPQGLIGPIGLSGSDGDDGLDGLLTSSSNVNPNGAAGGDLSGNYPNPTVAKINGNPLGSTTPSSGNLLISSTTNWVSTAVSQDATIDLHGKVTVTGINATPMTLEGTTQRVYRSPLHPATTALNITSVTAYFIYLGKTVTSITPKFVEFFVGATAGSETLCEVGFFSSPNPPNKSSQTLTKLVSGTVTTSLTANATNRNTSAFATAIAAGTQLWAGIKITFSIGPTLGTLSDDFAEGYVETIASATAFSTGTTYAATIPAATTYLTGIAVDLRGTLD